MRLSLSGPRALGLLSVIGYAGLSVSALAEPASDLRNATDLCKRTADRATVISSCSIVIGSSKDPRLLERAYNRRGMANEQNGQFDLAATDYSNVIRLDPAIAGYFDNRMRAYKGAGRLDLALKDADVAVRMAPTYAFPLHGRGAVRYEKGEFDLAIQDFTAALAIAPRDVAIHVDRGRAMMKLDRVNEALLDFEAAYGIDQTFEPALRERGLAFAELGRREEARADLASAVSLAPTDLVAAEALRRFDAADGSAAEKQTSKVEDPAGTTRGFDDRQTPTISSGSGFTPPDGAPFCTNRDELQEYVLAARKNDAQWMAQLKSCALVKGGLKIAVIDAGESVKGTHVDKVRIFDNGESMVGYTLTANDRGT